MAAPLSEFRRGDWVEVRSPDEIRATLDDDGRLDGLPFMPEMLRYCGRRFRVAASAHKTCDTISLTGLRHMPDAVHLEDVRCDGAGHGGCQARCLIFFKTAWLKAAGDGPSPGAADDGLETWLAARAASRDDAGATVYTCQATALLDATSPLPGTSPRQYWWDLRSGNVGLLTLVRYLLLAVFNKVQRKVGGRTHPRVSPRLDGRTPQRELGLRPGDFVQVRTPRDIEATLGPGARNRGLSFDVEMLPHCGRRRRVLGRVERIIDEKTGRLIEIPGDCLILDGVTCSGNVSAGRLFCRRAIYPYWREIWLERAGDAS